MLFFFCNSVNELRKSLTDLEAQFIIETKISDTFKKQELPPKTIISIHTRDHRDTTNLIKTFYVKFPQYRWLTFRDLRGLSEVEFAEAMKDSFVSVWIDEVSGWGTFPLESIKMGIPVIGLTPNLVPNWMGEDNGVWINNKNMLPDVVADFIQNWLEDNINPELYLNMEKTSENLSSEEKFKSEVLQFFNGAINTRLESFESQLNKLETI